MYTMKTSAISSRYLARGSFDGSLNLTCFPQSPRLVLHESPKEIPRDLVIVAAMKSHARRGNGARPRDPRSARRFSCRRLRYGVPSLSLSLSLYFFPPTIRPRFERNVHEQQVHAIYRVFITAVTRVVPCNFV